jgi:hypothetical protein
MPARGKGNGVRGKMAICPGGEEPAVGGLDDGSSPVIRFWVVGVVA